MVSALDVLSSLFFKHQHGQKVEGQGHKVKWKLCTKTSNICRKHHGIVEIYPALWEIEVAGANGVVRFFDRKQNKRYFCACALKKSPNHWKMYTDRRVIPLLQEIEVTAANGRDGFLTGSF